MRPKRETSVQVTGCALMASSFVFVLFFGVMGLGALFPDFALLALSFSALSFAAASAIVVGASVYRSLVRVETDRPEKL